MSVHILGLREYLDKQTGEVKLRHAFFENKWRAASINDLFNNLPAYIDMIPENQRYNLFYTAANVSDEIKGRVMIDQDIIPFDIDGLDLSRLAEYIDPVCHALKVDKAKTAIICSGNGLQFIVQIQYPMTYEDIFDEQRVFYKAMCDNINMELSRHMLSGKADSSVWSPARLLRLPDTENRKKGKEAKQAYFIQKNLEPQDFDLLEASGMPILQAGDDFISDNALKMFADPDGEAVQDGCDFLKHCKQNPSSVSEPMWYAMLSILGRLPDGNNLAHEYSSQHEGYSETETEFKLHQSITSSGPRTCANIATLWDGCAACPNWGKCKSPISLTGPEHIGTKETGFYRIGISANGGQTRTPMYSDLLKWFEKQHPFVTHMEGKMVYIYDDGVWSFAPRTYIEGFAEKWFDPSPSNQYVSEFWGKITRSNLKDVEWFESTRSMVNFKNGVLLLDTRELVPHSKDYAFQYKLPFNYDPDATCPRFDQYLDEVTCENKGIKDVLLEYMGYTLSGCSPEIGQKALILTGGGSNGKSVLLDLLKHMAGKGNYSSLYMGNELSKMENRHQLDGKLFNVSEEVPEKAMADSSLFKSLVTGGEVQARKLYCDSYSMKTNAKIIMACNELPRTTDTSHGILRRLLIVPFDRRFTEKDRDIHIRKKLFQEASGIFNRSLEGFDRFMKNEQFSESNAIKEQIKQYQHENDPYLIWFEDNYEESTTESPIPVSKLYEDYRYQLEDMGEKPMSMVAFGRRMREILGEDKTGIIKTVNDKRQRCVLYLKRAGDNNVSDDADF